MKRIHSVLCLLTMLAATTVAFAQSDTENTFTKLKALSGAWEGKITANIPLPQNDGGPFHVVLRTTSRGHALMHEMNSPGSPDDPITMMYLDGDRLLLTHFCDAGNRPRMSGKLSPDGKSVEFSFVDVAGSTEHGHMHGAKFTFIDADHHAEDWTFMMGKQEVHAHFDLHRVAAAQQKPGVGR